jgi:hypothetical protein
LAAAGGIGRILTEDWAPIRVPIWPGRALSTGIPLRSPPSGGCDRPGAGGLGPSGSRSAGGRGPPLPPHRRFTASKRRKAWGKRAGQLPSRSSSSSTQAADAGTLALQWRIGIRGLVLTEYLVPQLPSPAPLDFRVARRAEKSNIPIYPSIFRSFIGPRQASRDIRQPESLAGPLQNRETLLEISAISEPA